MAVFDKVNFIETEPALQVHFLETSEELSTQCYYVDNSILFAYRKSIYLSAD